MATIKRIAGVSTVAAFRAGAALFRFEGSFSENIWLAVTYGSFAASTVFGVVAARQWPLFFAIPSALMIVVTGIGMAFIGGV